MISFDKQREALLEKALGPTAPEFTDAEREIAAIAIAQTLFGIDFCLRGYRRYFTDDDEGNERPDPDIIHPDKAAAETAIERYRELNLKLGECSLLLCALPSRRLRFKLAKWIRLAHEGFGLCDSPAELYLHNNDFDGAIECIVEGARSCRRTVRSNLQTVAAEILAWYDARLVRLPDLPTSPVSRRFKPGPCPECESTETRVTTTKQRMRHLQCQKCNHSWKVSRPMSS